MENKYDDLLQFVLDDVKNDISNEELISIILDEKFAKNIHKKSEKYTLGQRMADNIAKTAGSWYFIGTFMFLVSFWIFLNVSLLKENPYDSYPFILLNLVLSCIAAIQAPLIMMSQNRQEAKDRERSENDYRINLKSEIILEDIHKKLTEVLNNQSESGNKVS